MVSFEPGKEIKDAFSSIHERGTKKKDSFILCNGFGVRVGAEFKLNYQYDQPWCFFSSFRVIFPIFRGKKRTFKTDLFS